jgi:hypothetical protein
MAPRILPSEPPAANMSIAKVSAANTLTPAFGGADAEMDRKGERYALTFTLPAQDYADAAKWSVLNRKGRTYVMEVHQPGVVIPAQPGPRVKGAGQAGSQLLIDGLIPGQPIKAGWFLTVISAGQRYLYRADDDTAASAEGAALIDLQEMLRRPPNDNDVVELEKPMIEGLPRDVREISVGPDKQVVVEFTLRETE